MLQFALYSARLLFQGRLFRDPAWVLRQGVLGTGLALALFFVLHLAGAPLVVTVLTTAFLGGAITPWLFRDLKAQ